MSIEVKIPAVGESISSGIVSVWHKKSGEHVKAGEPLFTLETDKVSTEIVAERAGVLETLAAEGQEVKIGEIVATIDESATAAPEASVATPADVKDKPDPNRKEAPTSGEKKSPNAEVLVAGSAPDCGRGKTRSSGDDGIGQGRPPNESRRSGGGGEPHRSTAATAQPHPTAAAPVNPRMGVPPARRCRRSGAKLRSRW